jgi:hypothetical protein
MKKLILSIAFIASSLVASAQVGIGTIDPKTTLQVDASAVAADADGVLVPRVTVANLNTKAAAYGADQNGSLVFVTAITGAAGKTSDVTGTGFYYYNNGTSKWTAVSGAGNTYTGSTSVTLNGSSFERAALTGDVTAAANSNATTVARLQGRDVAATAPTAGQVLTWNNTTSTWEPAAAAAPANSAILVVANLTPTYTGQNVILDNNTGNHNFTLPNPASATYTNKIIFYRNNSNEGGGVGTASFITYTPVNNPTCIGNRGMTLYSNGTSWYVVGGF